jgi:hypothetical protein
MAADTRRQLPILIGLLVLLFAVAWWNFGGTAAAPTTATARAARPAARPGPAGGAPGETAAQVLGRGVGLERLAADRPAPEEAGRDPFRAAAAANTGQANPEASQPVQSPPPPMVPISPEPSTGPPPITLKFIGLVSRRDVGKVAVLTDGKNVYYGRAGDIVDGRWRIVSIGEESLQIEYADGRGRQSVRLSG